MRTNIEIDDDLIARAMRTTGLATKAAVIDMALQTLLDLKTGQARAVRGTAETLPGGGIGGRRDVDLASPSRQVELDLFAAHMAFGTIE